VIAGGPPDSGAHGDSHFPRLAQGEHGELAIAAVAVVSAAAALLYVHDPA